LEPFDSQRSIIRTGTFRKTEGRAFGKFDAVDHADLGNIGVISKDDLYISKSCNNYLIYGWNCAEDYGCWSKARRCGIRFQFYPNIISSSSAGVKIKLTIQSLSIMPLPQRIQIWIGTSCLLNHQLDGRGWDGDMYDIVCDLSGNWRNAPEIVDLRLVFSYLKPLNSPEFPDPRPLGFKLIKMCLVGS
jgi:hypothetical protein